MNYIKTIFLSFYLLLTISVSYCYSNNDSINPKVDSIAVFYFYLNTDSIFIPKLIPIDTNLKDVQRYNPLQKWHNYYASLGNNGLACDKTLFSPTLSTGFDFGLHAFDNYLFTNQNTQHFKNYIPYTDVFYVMGRNREHYLELLHNQNITKNLSVGLNFRLINSPGFYASQETNNSSVMLVTNYSAKSKRYNLETSFIHNGVKVQENGGIENDSTFDYNQETNRKIIEVNLDEANRRIKETAFFIRNAYNLSKKIPQAIDTSNILIPSVKKAFNAGNLSHTFTYNRKLIIYEDGNPTSGFYPVINFDSLHTHDSTAIINFENRVAWSNFDKADDDNFLNATFALTIRNIKLTNDSGDYRINQLAVSAKVAKSLLKQIIVFLTAEYIAGDHNNGDHNLTGQINWHFGEYANKSKLLSFKVGYTNQEPAWLYQYHYSNNFIWNNSFGRQKSLNSVLMININDFNAKINYYNINSYLHFNTEAFPDQSDEAVNVITASVFKTFKVGKFQFDNEIIYQYDGNSEVVRLPALTLNHSIYFIMHLFNKAVSMQTGIDVFYNTAYYSNAYMPATGIFYLQNEKKTGNYPYVDLFVNVKIKRAMIFAKYEHINKGLFDYNYYMTPHYPMPDGAFKFGVKWRFYN